MANSSKEFVFRGALVRTCNNMGTETWTSFCFMYGIPDSVRELCRGDVLKYLVDKGDVSAQKPESFAELLRTQLGQAKLAQTFLDILAEEAPIETRDIVNRRLHSADRRGGRHLSHFILDAASPLEEEEEDGGVEDSRDGAILRRPDGYPLSVTPTEDRDASRHRHGSMLSMYSDRSSGYFSQRSYSVTSMYLDHPLDHPVSEATQQLEQLQVSHEASPEPQPTSLSSPSSSSSSSSSSSAPSSTVDDDFQSCSSGSLESLPSSSGSLPRSVTAAAIKGDLEGSELQRREQCPQQSINIQTYSTITKTDSITLSLRDIRSDIEHRLKDRVYCSVSSPDRHQHGVDFKMSFYPVNHECSGAALDVDIVSYLDNKVIPPLNITVCVREPSAGCGGGRDSVCLRKSKECLAHEQRKSTLTFQSQYTALFRKLVDHKRFRKATGESVVVQVMMEYTTQHTM